MSNRKNDSRKADHLKICLEKDVESSNTAFSAYALDHLAAPELDFDEITLETKFLGKKFSAPLIIEAMTGGVAKAGKINRDVAEVAQEFGIGFGVGSQRIIFDDKRALETYKVRDVAPDIFLIANLGAVQLNYGYGVKECQEAVDLISADALALHLNPLQEAIQPEGNTNFSDLIKKINLVSEKLNKPIIVKETGCGISSAVAKKLKVSAIDVSGAGGTSWGLIEGYRGDALRKKASETFSLWGIPTAFAIDALSKEKIPIIGSGGIRNGLDCAKALALGASTCGFALPILSAWAASGKDGVRDFLNRIIFELKLAMFLTGSKNVSELKGKIKRVI